MKKLILIFVLIFAGICEAPTYKENIGAYQKDSSGADYYWNIGADQTDEEEAAPPAAPAKKGQIIVIQGN